MKDDSEIRTTLTAIEQEMHNMLEGNIQPYDAGRKIWDIAMSKASESKDILNPLWLIWGALTDWVENKPDEQAKAEHEMLRAAREWLSLNPDDQAAKSAYLDRWVYDEMGYERKNEQPEQSGPGYQPQGVGSPDP